jgi:hypothetical protein
MSVLQRLTEGVVTRNVQKEGEALLNKWEATGLLEGLNEGQQKQGMAVLLENQAKELLREASSMAAGDVEGFAAVAFPIVRRVFGGLIANDLVSVQPMSLPSGLIFFLDFTHNAAQGGPAAGASIYGGNVVGKQLQTGVNLNSGSAVGLDAGGHYDLGNAFANATGSATITFETLQAGECLEPLGGEVILHVSASDMTENQKKAIRFDADILADTDHTFAVLQSNAELSGITAHDSDSATLSTVLDQNRLAGLTIPGLQTNVRLVRRLTRVVANRIVIVLSCDEADGADDLAAAAASQEVHWPALDHFAAGDATGAIVGKDAWGLEEPTATGKSEGGDKVASDGRYQNIPEIDIKVDSIAVTAQTKKLKAKWTPELGQDLNAYHNLDAEVELTGILSEQIALEIDRELLSELVNGATAGTRYWSRAPGLFVDSNGKELGATSAAPDFTGTVSEWYETLIETINDVSAQIHRKTLRGGANFVVCSPEVANILEFTSGFRASVTADQDRGTIGAVKAGSLSKKFDVYVDPYFLRNVVLVGRKGNSFLESGFVYAPYVPLQVTPTIFGTEDFVPRKGVMTRYAKKMVRPDMYGLVIVRGLLGEAGAS